MAGLKLTPIILKEVNRYLTSPKKVRKFGFDQPPVKTGKDIKRPEDPFREFEERNPQADGGRTLFGPGGQALKQKYLQQDYKKYGKDKLEEATQKMLSLGEEDFIKPERTIPKLDASSLKDVKNYEDLDTQLKRKIKTKLDKYGKYVGEAEARILGRKDKTLTDRKTLPDQGAKIVKEGDRIVDINFADPEIKKQFLEDFDRRYKGSRMTAKQRGVDNASLYKKYLSNLTPKTAELALAGLARSQGKIYEVRPYGFYDAQTNIKRTERLEKAAKKAGKDVIEINKEQKKVVKLLNDFYKNNPQELLNNTKLRNILDLTLKDGEIVKKNKYVKDEDFLELIKKKKGGLFNIDHVDEVQFEKLSTEFPVFKQLATYNTNSGLIRSMKSYISKNQNSKDPVVQDKIKKQIEFLEDLKLRIDTPKGRVGSKKVLDAIDRKAGTLPNFLAQLKALNIKLPGKAKTALLGIGGGLGATTLAAAGPIEETGSTAMDTAKTVGAAGTGAAAVGTKTGRNILGKTFRTLGTRAAGSLLAADQVRRNIQSGENVADAVLDPLVGLELSFPGLFKENIAKITKNPTAQRILNLGKFARLTTPVGLGITAAGLGIDAAKFTKKRIEELKAMSPEQRQALRARQSAFAFEGAREGGIIGKKSGPPPVSGKTPHGLPYETKGVKKL